MSADTTDPAPPSTTTAAEATAMLHVALGPGAAFREGQLEAITALVDERRRLLVVQRTGWGKSSVYFLTTRLLRARGAGLTLLVSPLLALMRDQVRAAERFGVRAARLDSSNTDEWDDIIAAVEDDDLDLLLVSPERLANRGFRTRVLDSLLPRVGLFVVDEAHCISDWGHDFRPDYRRIRPLLDELAPGTPVLATTATANDAVVHDVVHQLGGGVEVLRGPLSRAGLKLQATHLSGEVERMAWLAEHLPGIDGSGIIYVLTKAHARRVAEFLRSQGIDAEHYTGGGEPGGRDEQRKLRLEQRLLDNDLKALVATPALGMGFDKPDLAFVIHFQMPQSLVHYYQQVGRAGRAVDDSVGVLLHGDGDQRITDWFAAQAFPTPEAVDAVVAAIRRAGPDGLTTTDAAKRARIGRALADKVLGQLAVELPAPVELRSGRWRPVEGEWHYDLDRAQRLDARRREEYARIVAYARNERCLMAFVAAELDDPSAGECGRCCVCLSRAIIPEQISDEAFAAAVAWSPAPSKATRRRRKRPPTTTARTKRRRRRKT